VTDGADVDVRLGPLELRLSHGGLLLLLLLDSLPVKVVLGRASATRHGPS